MPIARVVLAALVLSGCAYESKAPPISSSTMETSPPSQQPQSANSLPRGSAVSAPILPDNGPGNMTTRTAP